MLRASSAGLRLVQVHVGAPVRRYAPYLGSVPARRGTLGNSRAALSAHIASTAIASTTQSQLVVQDPEFFDHVQTNQVGLQADQNPSTPAVEETQENVGEAIEDEYMSFTDTIEHHPRPTLRLVHHEPGPLRLVRRRKPKPDLAEPLSSEDSETSEPFPEELRADWLDLLGTTTSIEEGWEAYQTLVSLPIDVFPLIQTRNGGPPLQIPHRYLHRLASMLASARPLTRETFLRLHAVLSTIHHTGGILALWEWNALIHAAGGGARKLQPNDIQRALDMFTDLVERRLPGTTLAQRNSVTPEEDVPEGHLQSGPEDGHAVPDIITYTTLLDLAARSKHIPLLQHARTLLRSSGFKPTAVTHRVLLRHFTRTQDLDGVRDTLSRMRAQGLPLGREGINAVAWAFAYNGRLDIAEAIYRVMRASIPKDGSATEGATEEGPLSTFAVEQTIESTRQYLDETENILVPEGLVPDATTYTLLIQGFAYHGKLLPALQIFHDMLTTMDRDIVYHIAAGEFNTKTAAVATAPDNTAVTEAAPQGPYFAPTYPIYRALFLGFAKNAVPFCSPHGGRSHGSQARINLFGRPLRHDHPNHAAARKAGWTHDQLYVIFKSFLALPRDTRPSERVIYWILRAFERATDGDVQKLRKVYATLEKRFGGGWGGRLARAKAALFPDSGEKPKLGG